LPPIESVVVDEVVMQIRLYSAIILFLASYFPLALILIVQDIRPEYWSRGICTSVHPFVSCELPRLGNPGLAWTFLAVCGVSLILFVAVMRLFEGPTEMLIKASKSIPNDLINYVFPYIVSFMGVELSATGKVVGFALFMVWMFLISYRSGQILMNPLLLVFGWQLYEIEAESEGHKRTLRALSKDRVVANETLRSCLVQGIYVLTKAGKK
jgi:hypothetical protein